MESFIVIDLSIGLENPMTQEKHITWDGRKPPSVNQAYTFKNPNSS